MKSTSDNPATTEYTIFYQFIAMATIISVLKIGEAINFTIHYTITKTHTLLLIARLFQHVTYNLPCKEN